MGDHYAKFLEEAVIQLLLGQAAAAHGVEEAEDVDHGEFEVIYQINFDLFQHPLPVNYLHEEINHFVFELRFYEGLIHIFHEVGLPHEVLAAKCQGHFHSWVFQWDSQIQFWVLALKLNGLGPLARVTELGFLTHLKSTIPFLSRTLHQALPLISTLSSLFPPSC